MLTNERINRMVGRTNWLLITFANGTQSIALDPVAARNFARAIEAEVLQSQELVGGITPFNPLNAASNVLPCRAQNATHAPQDVLQNADATQAHEPVAWLTDDNVCDKSATTYDPKVAQRWKEKGWPVTALYAAPQPPAPCPKCAEHIEYGTRNLRRRSVELAEVCTERDALQAKVAALEAEAAENCRIIGMSSEMEARHLARIAELEQTIALLRTGDTCARQCEGTAYRIEVRSLQARIETLIAAFKIEREGLVAECAELAAQCAELRRQCAEAAQ